MNRAGRELTLFSIYGAAPRKPAVPRPRHATRSVPTGAPQRPVNPPDPSGQDEKRSEGPEVRAVRLDGQDATRVSEMRAPDVKRVVRSGDGSGAECPSLDVNQHEPQPNRGKVPEKAVSGHGSPRSRAEAGKRSPAMPPQCVMSLYGDGFIELIPRPGALDTLTVPFSIRIRMFKAADESMGRGRVESDASRHVSPELNDEGEFVRWSCCGSTDKSVFGCPVASNEQHENLTVEEMLTLRPPKLVASKVSTSKTDPMDKLRFVIFDRGYPASLSPSDVGALNAGCRVWWQGYECWATNYEIPHGCWVDFTVSFDGHYLQIRIDGKLVDTAIVSPSGRVPHRQCRSYCPLGCLCSGSQLSNTSAGTGSIYIGGYAKYSKRVNEWRAHAGFVGLIAEAKMCVGNMGSRVSCEGDESGGTTFAHLIALDVSELRNLSPSHMHGVVIRRNVFWRKVFPTFCDASIQYTIRLLGNFYHGAHHDISSSAQSSFEVLLVSAVQVGEVRIHIELSKVFVPKFGSEHGCRTQAEYDLKCSEFIHKLEALSPLLVVVVNANGPRPCVGSFEVYLEFARSAANSVTICLHSMIATSCFPSLKDVKTKIGEIIFHEARRSPGEGVVQQAIRHLLSLAEQGRDSRERAFMESVMNRKAVITEKRITAVFQRIGFHFAHTELQDLIRLFKTMQEEYHRHQHRMDDIPTMSLISPTSRGLYRLPLIHRVSVNIITPSDRSVTRSKWDFLAILLNYDLQLLDFIHSGCCDSAYGNASYAQSRYLHGGFVDRLSIHVSDVPSHVYCILFSLRKHCSDHPSSSAGSSSQLEYQADRSNGHYYDEQQARPITVQLENGETLQQLAHFEVQATNPCKWLSLAALYRSKKTKLWRFQALGGCTQATSIHTGLEHMNAILIERHIVQVYEIVVTYEIGQDTSEFAEFANAFSKNIRFGRNGKIQIVPLARNENTRRGMGSDSFTRHPKLLISLHIQGIVDEIIVYRHDENASSLPTVQSVCRSILRTLAEHGIKESLQQNPFVAGAKKSKRPVMIRVTTEDTNTPVPSAYIFVEKSLDNQNAISNLASKIVPTLTMGSRLVSIRRRLQKKKYSEEVRVAAQRFTETVISAGIRYAVVSLRDLKLVPVVRSRAVLRRAMRYRYERIRENIFSAMSESERSRIYSRSGPTRLQQLFRPRLNFTPSEKELVNEIVELEVEAFRRELGLAGANTPPDNPQDHIDAIWQNHVNGDHSTLAHQDGDMSHQERRGSAAYEYPETEVDSPQQTKKPKRSYLTDMEGAATCHLAPGSYSFYVFHNEYFEWTSLTVIFPSVNASGLLGGSLSTSAPQEIVVPLETFKWPYGIQIVDFYHQHVPKQIAGVPIVVVDKVTSEETILRTRGDGSVAWDVRKGIYAVRVDTEGTSIVYSGSKNVVVDGGRYHPPRTIFIPILLGKVPMELTISNAPRVSVVTADVAIMGESDNRRLTPSPQDGNSVHAGDNLGVTIAHAQSMDTTTRLQLRPGRFKLRVYADGHFPYSSLLNVPWDAKGNGPCREMVVLCPIFDSQRTYRVIFSYVNGAGIFHPMVEIVEAQVLRRVCWQRGLEVAQDDVIFHGTTALDNCEFQAFSIVCQPGRSYFVRVGVSPHVQSQLGRLQPRVQVYNNSGLVLDTVLLPGITWKGEFYWSPCSWNSHGEITTQAPSV